MRVIDVEIIGCDECKWTSSPGTHEQGEAALARHMEKHQREARWAKAAELGHEYRPIDVWIDNDDSGGRAGCTCGWKSRYAKANWLRGFFDGHVDDVLRQAGRKRQR